ncbi:MAG: ABC transporter ATP-binding protein [Acidimicrobiia bacterium]|nr:ABC transporter ATP-binding protein [Acidimicrobiia bacterium]
MNSEPAIRVRGLVKRYGDLDALAGVDLEVATGECFALLGPNGAGKTTFVEILEGYRSRTAGHVDVLGFDPATGGLDLRRRIGIVLQQAGIEMELSVLEALDYYGGLYPTRRPLDEVIDSVGLTEKRNAKVKTLSGGQRRRLDLALVLTGDGDLFFLDEPTTGFDPSARHSSWELIRGLRSLGKTILLTTHYMDEAENLADRVAILVAGKVVAQGPPDTLAGRETGKAEITFRLPQGMSGADLPTELSGFTVDSGEVVVSTDQPTALMYALSAWALERGTELHGLTITRPSLEAVYLKLAGSQQSEDGQI